MRKKPENRLTATTRQGILKAIESLCLALDISIVAEGVETEEELDYLRTHTSIRLAQGYRFARPQFLDALVLPSAACDPQTLARIAGTRSTRRLVQDVHEWLRANLTSN